jgi:hypothetical protein
MMSLQHKMAYLAVAFTRVYPQFLMISSMSVGTPSMPIWYVLHARRATLKQLVPIVRT